MCNPIKIGTVGRRIAGVLNCTECLARAESSLQDDVPVSHPWDPTRTTADRQSRSKAPLEQ